MRIPFRLVLVLAIATLIAASCSSTTSVASDERSSSDEAAETSRDEVSEALDTGSNDADDAEDAVETDETDSGTQSNEPPSDTSESNAETETGDDADSAPESARDLQEVPGFGLGDETLLGSLSDDCNDGSDMACDILFQVSGFASFEEATALTCGGRSEVEVIFCTEGIDAVPNQLFFDEDSEGLPAIITACEDDGDMTACDFLYARSPIDSETEALGATCGGRTEVAIPDCRTFLSES